MDMNNFLQSEATQFVGTAAANTIGLVIGTIHEDIKELLEIPDEYQAISRYLVHHLARHLALSVLPQQESALLPLTSA